MLGLFFLRLFLFKIEAYPALVIIGEDVLKEGFALEIDCCVIDLGLHLGSAVTAAAFAAAACVGAAAEGDGSDEGDASFRP
mmetsp:Transcript_1295/g.2124  ORF Transcript_1295/g.2124 Transcript_1295/m.2124 type:complete len:81 (-) Transcript_1295:357-599(-)